MPDAKGEPTAVAVPPAHQGAHYQNPSSKPLEGPVSTTDRTSTQRLVWKVFFVLILCVVAMGIVLGMVFRHT